MNFKKFILSVVVITLIALIYVHQQVEFVKLSYRMNQKQSELAELLDSNKALLYNVVALKNPIQIEARLLDENIELDLPEQWKFVARTKEVPLEKKMAAASFGRILSKILSPKAEAQAQE